MARITLDDDFWPLASRLGVAIGDLHRAIGMMVNFKNYAQNKFKNGRAVTKSEMTINDFDLRMVGICAVEVEGGYQWWNADEEFAWLRERCDAARRGGQKSAEVRWGQKAEEIGTLSDSADLRVSKRKQSVSKNNPHALPHTHELTLVHEESMSASGLHWLAEFWNSQVKSLPKVSSHGKKRLAKILQAVKARPREQWETIVKNVEESDFLTGRDGKWANCGFDWILIEANATKIFEGNYRNKSKKHFTHQREEENFTSEAEEAWRSLNDNQQG